MRKKNKAGETDAVVKSDSPAVRSFLVKVDAEPFGHLRLTVPADTAEAAMQRVLDDLRSKMTMEG